MQHQVSVSPIRAVLDSRFRITIPLKIRAKLGLQPGEQLILAVKDGGLFLISPQAIEEAKRKTELRRRAAAADSIS